MKRHRVKLSYIWNMDHRGDRREKLFYCTVCKERVSVHMDGKYYHIED